jgi:endonuclease YncB( thermonuclease family)
MSPRPTTLVVPQTSYPISPRPTTLVVQPLKPSTLSNTVPETKQWVNLKGQVFTESSSQWYNLRTSRFVANQPGTYSPVYGLKGIRVLGTREDIENFWRANATTLTHTLPRATLDSLIFQPFEDVTFLAEDVAERSQLCFIGSAGTVIPAATSTDVASLTENQMEAMCSFTFAGLFVKGRIDNVTDGDTFDIVFFVPISVLGRARAIGVKGAPQTSVIPTAGYEQTGFFAKVSIRMYGYDAAEKDTDAGKLAKRLMEEKFRSLGGIVWCQFIEITVGTDKYGRTLSVLYEDEKKQRLLNDYLLEMEKVHKVKMVNPYLGGTKKQF